MPLDDRRDLGRLGLLRRGIYLAAQQPSLNTVVLAPPDVIGVFLADVARERTNLRPSLQRNDYAAGDWQQKLLFLVDAAMGAAEAVRHPLHRAQTALRLQSRLGLLRRTGAHHARRPGAGT